MKKTALALTTSVALFLSFSAIPAAASMNPGPLCGRFPSLADRFPSCRDTSPPPPADVCPNVPGNQSSRPCADEQCVEQGGTWAGEACELPPPPPPPPGDDDRGNRCDRYLLTSRDTPPQSCDICPNVPGVQLTGQCADKLCVDDGGLWNGTSCIDMCPNVPGYQSGGLCADQQCVDDGGTWNGDSCDLPFVRVTYPNGGETVTAGDIVEIKWEGRDIKNCSLEQGTHPGAQTRSPIASNIDGLAQSFSWIALGEPLNLPPAHRRIFITCTTHSGGAVEDYSDEFFNILPSPECADGYDNDLNSKIDYPNDANCTSADDNQEENPLQIYAQPQDSSYGTVTQTVWGALTVLLTDEPIVLGPMSFTVTTTGMEGLTKMVNVWLDGFPPFGQILGSPKDVPLVNGVGVVTFSDPVSFSIGGKYIYFQATFPFEERWKISSDATITITANPALNWNAVAADSGEEMSLDSIAPLNLGTLRVFGSSSSRMACYDGKDNDADGKTDYPSDSDCSPQDDDSETPSGGAGAGGGGGGGSN